MDQLIEQGALTAFLGRGSSFHTACKDTYDRRPPQPFRLWIRQGDVRIGPEGFENALCEVYGTIRLMQIPHDEWQPVVHTFVGLWKESLRKFAMTMMTGSEHWIWHRVTPRVVLSESLSMWLNDMEVSPIGTIQYNPDWIERGEPLTMHYKLAITTPLVSGQLYNDTFLSAIEVSDQVFDIDCNMNVAFLPARVVEGTFQINLDCKHAFQILGAPGLSGGSLFADSMQ
jgi:hypothetical protein